eukprot:CAMPEP_0170512950 /NCGR_PEP_ID=MMETSP0208-20121228/67133_1 /TAXON_ID=197538 /ORGANISM="Strombidium inclinatum, Strain S3" /LENGTH=72 /DNA_ID=CAMNT_0010796631 /DNA_START=582 /DNA_END=800 /DNA_ORIENTATION=+
MALGMSNSVIKVFVLSKEQSGIITLDQLVQAKLKVKEVAYLKEPVKAGSQSKKKQDVDGDDPRDTVHAIQED